MDAIINLINENAALVQGVATVALVVITWRYVVLTRGLAEESRRQSEATTSMVNLTYRSHLQPVLVFYNPGDARWRVKNVGNGPALNVLVGGGSRQKEWDEDHALLLSAVAPGEEVMLDWVKKTGALCSVYCDAAGREYTSECAGNRNTVSDGNQYPSLQPRLFQFQLGRLRTTATAGGSDSGVA